MEYSRSLKEELLDKLEQIIESIDVIQHRTADYSDIIEMQSSPWGMTVLDAAILRLQVIGETIRAIDNKTQGELLAHFPSTPWRLIIGLRNIISHEYANIDYDIIWTVIAEHLEPLKTEIEKVKEYIM